MNRLTGSLLIVSTILLIAGAGEGAVELLALDSPRAGVKLKLLLDKPEKPDAVLVMLPGGLGNVGVKDACEETPPARVEDLKGKFRKARTVELKWIEGGLPPQSDPCQALSAHGFYGVEGEAVRSIVDFVKANSK